MTKLRITHLAILFVWFSISAKASDYKTKYWVFFTTKDTTHYDYTQHLSVQTLYNRKLQNLPLWQYSDIPVRTDFIKKLKEEKINIICKSKWLNAVSAELSLQEVEKVKRFDFVAHIQAMETQWRPLQYHKKKKNVGEAMQQLELEAFQRQNLNGEGILIGVIDAGFYGAHESELLAHLDSTRILGMRDFVNPKQKDLFREQETNDDDHGKTVLEMIGGYSGSGKQVGAATAAKFYLARTDHGVTETRSEEDFWVMAMEWMDSAGVKLINTSLGYSVGFDDENENYNPSQMDGNTSVVSKAAKIAFQEKGILLVVSAGNEGWDSDWRIVSTPGDSPFALSVGATNGSGLKMGYSSIGADFVDFLKPNVACYSLTGTSFSAPNITGFAACLWQHKLTATNKEIFETIEKSATLYPFGNNYVGYGIPKASKAIALLDGKTFDSAIKEVKADKDKYQLVLAPNQRALVYHKKDKRLVVNQFSKSAQQDKSTTKVTIKRPSEGIKFTTVFIEGVGGLEIVWN